ncbi:DUF1828 domain-containing protein [Cupriavidus oxalaticus]|uniref:DUF1828 domain-containing protein n=1 Tax=Cupriavidus oxalaticus TaxID=96344 RepID=A0A976BFJ3_9BURK|nr:DUF1828 domain-containing protein [Cupriavidus oxalaticus]QRQ86281.1 DUF1828 domain-containing protein [Cupriavidus oxalaticus]QRQ95392.1 DUF1828 domain-containing protein [Cupriavidus oxalaticus]WQD84047.1 DUF1828 domain-containing protein [Cupriavidus oxalaticus]SPC17361.1 conserved hypothetical protein [Cupriavidus oxalaticus]
MTLNCAWLRQNFAYECRQVRTVNGEPALEVGTPFSFADGTAIVFYMVEQGTHTLISDNGDTLAHLSSVGLDPFNRRRESAIRNILAPFGVALEANGEIRAIGASVAGPHVVATYIASLLALASQERGWLGVPEQVNNFADEVEHYLRLWKPAEQIVRHPKAKGISRHEYTFDFLWGNELVDVVTPSHQATGGLMRKLGDVMSAPGEPPIVRVIIDDRDDFERAETEKQIIGSMASAMLFSSLTKAAGTQTWH